MNRRVISIVIVLIVAALLAVGAYQTYKSGQRKATPAITPIPSPTPKPLSLLDYLDSDDAQVTFTTVGRIVAKENHNSLIVTISKKRRTVESISNYAGNPVVQQEFDNNQPAFEDFMRALQNAGFVTTKKNDKASATELGLCPSGLRYIYEFTAAGSELQRSWSTSCSDPTIFFGNSNTIRSLFQAQIPDYNKITSPIRL
jgi:hypothetical protein